MTKKIFKLVSFIFYLILTTVLLLELIFWLLPTAQLFEKEHVNDDQPILKYKPDQSVTFSLGPTFYQIAKKNTNNYGFVNPEDYEKNSEPYFAVIGDSFVEAMQINFDDSISGVLQKKTGKEVYSFAVSGTSLSQYIVYAEYAEKMFNPQRYIFVIIGNDFDQSICSVKKTLPTNYYQGQYCFDKNWKLKLNDFNGYSLINYMARNSNFLRYVVLNLRINPRSIFSKRQDIQGTEISNTNLVSNLENSSYKVIDLFLEKISLITNGKPVYLILDADRNQIYNNTNNSSYFNKMRAYIKNSESYKDFKIIDLMEPFQKNYSDTKIKPEFTTDAHWNELGHMIASESFLEKFLEDD